MTRDPRRASPVGSRAPEPEESAQSGLAPTCVLAAGTFAVGTDAFVVAAFLPALAADLGTTTGAAGQSVTVFAIGYALMAPLVATFTSTVPRRRLLVSALLLLAAANLISAVSPTLAVLLISRVLAAAAAAAYTPTAAAVTAVLVRPELRGRGLAIVVGGLTVATALGVPLGGLASQWLGWRSALGLVAALCVLSALGIVATMRALPGTSAPALRSKLRMLRAPAVAAVLPVTALGMAGAYTAYAYSVPVLSAVGVGQATATALLFLYGLGAVLGNLAAGWGTDRWAAVPVLTVAYLGMAAALGALALLAHAGITVLAVAAVLTLAWGAASWAQTPPQQHRLVAGVSAADATLAVALNSSCIYLGIAIGTAIGGWLLEYDPTIVLTAGAALALITVTYLRWSSARQTLNNGVDGDAG